MALFATIIVFISAFITGIMSDSDISFRNFKYIYYFFVQAVVYFGVAFLLALLLKKTALTIGLFFVYSLIIENVLERYINKINIGIEKIGGFLPVSSSEHLLIPKELKELLYTTVNIGDTHSEYAYLIASIVYIVLCGWACYCIYKKQDL
jgi:hypothetical protein